MKNDFYEEKISEIKKMIDNKKPTEALSLLVEELKMPYVPEKYEKVFVSLKQDILFELNDENPVKEIKLDSLVEMLWKTDEEQAIALNLLQRHNLRPIKEEIKKRIESFDDKDAIKRTYLFEILATQEIDMDIKIGKTTINPSLVSISKNEEVKKAFMYIENSNTKMPQIINPSLDELQRYLLITFPEFPTDGKLLGDQMLNIVYSLIDKTKELNKAETNILNILNKY